MTPDPTLWPAADFDALVETFRATGFRSGNAWYMNDTTNIAYAHAAPDGGRLRRPVLFVNGEFDGICDITRSRLSEPMRRTCPDLSVTNLQFPMETDSPASAQCLSVRECRVR